MPAVCGKDLATTVFRHESPGGLQIARPGVVAETLPGVQHIRFPGARERGEIRETLEPALIIRKNGRDLGLLEHEFRDQDRVRVAGAAPRKIAAPGA